MPEWEDSAAELEFVAREGYSPAPLVVWHKAGPPDSVAARGDGWVARAARLGGYRGYPAYGYAVNRTHPPDSDGVVAVVRFAGGEAGSMPEAKRLAEWAVSELVAEREGGLC